MIDARFRFSHVFIVMLAVLFAWTSMRAQELRGAELVAALQKGGCVLVIRHARSPQETPDERTANEDNPTRERQLDETGRAQAAAMGEAMRDLGIPIGVVQSSPAYRALETARRAGWPEPEQVAELGDRGRSMQGVSETDSAWLRRRVTRFPAGTNTILVTHLPNVTGAFPQEAAGIGEGDALVFGPDRRGGAAVVGRIGIAEWPSLR